MTCVVRPSTQSPPSFVDSIRIPHHLLLLGVQPHRLLRLGVSDRSATAPSTGLEDVLQRLGVLYVGS